MTISMQQSASATNPQPVKVDLARFRGRGVQPRTNMWPDEVTGHLVDITLRPGEYPVMRDGKPVVDRNGQQLMRPNSAIAEWIDDNGQRVLTNWPCRYDDNHNILLWDAFDSDINLKVDHLHFKKVVENRRTWYTLERVQVEVQSQPDTGWEDYYC